MVCLTHLKRVALGSLEFCLLSKTDIQIRLLEHCPLMANLAASVEHNRSVG